MRRKKQMIDWGACQPVGGWKDSTHYAVLVQWRDTNPPHKAILYTGFMERDGSPGSYSGVFNPTYEPTYLPVEGLFSLRVIEELKVMEELI